VVAAQAARQQGLTIYTIGVGVDAETLRRTYGQQNIPSDVALNEPLLRGIAEVTGGEYFRATNSRGLEKIYGSLDKLEPVEHKFQSHRPREELFLLPLVGAILIMLLLIGWSIQRSRLAHI
jgi:Ca-activated chloride channel family protein